jgi:hypothetical protein
MEKLPEQLAPVAVTFNVCAPVATPPVAHAKV